MELTPASKRLFFTASLLFGFFDLQGTARAGRVSTKFSVQKSSRTLRKSSPKKAKKLFDKIDDTTVDEVPSNKDSVLYKTSDLGLDQMTDITTDDVHTPENISNPVHDQPKDITAGNIPSIPDTISNTTGVGQDYDCISDYHTLEAKLSNATDDEHIILCEGSINVTRELRVTANGVVMSCDGVSGSCILDSNATDERILNVTGAGVTLMGIQFWNGTADGNGGAVSITGRGFAPVEIHKCAFLGNTASGSGGALYVQDHACVVRIEDSVFMDNEALVHGGGVCLSAGPMMCRLACPYAIYSSAFVDNTARGNGGAVFSNFFLCEEDNLRNGNEAVGLCDGVGVFNAYENSTECSDVSQFPQLPGIP